MQNTPNYPNSIKRRTDVTSPLQWIDVDNNFQFPNAWKSSKSYSQGMQVLWNDYLGEPFNPHGEMAYWICTSNHLSSNSNAPGTGLVWEKIAGLNADYLHGYSYSDFITVDGGTVTGEMNFNGIVNINNEIIIPSNNLHITSPNGEICYVSYDSANDSNGNTTINFRSIGDPVNVAYLTDLSAYLNLYSNSTVYSVPNFTVGFTANGATFTGLTKFNAGLTANGAIFTGATSISGYSAMFMAPVNFENGFISYSGGATFNGAGGTTGLSAIFLGPASFNYGLTASTGYFSTSLTVNNTFNLHDPINNQMGIFKYDLPSDGNGTTTISFNSTGATEYVIYASDLVGIYARLSGGTFSGITHFSAGLTATGATFNGNIQATGYKTPTGTSTGFLKADGSTDTTTYQPKGPTSTVVLSAASWVANSQTVTVSGVTSSNTVMIGAPTDRTQFLQFASSVISCTAQGANSLTFVCNTTPNIDITLNIKIES